MTLLIATSWIIHEPTDCWLFPALAGLLVCLREHSIVISFSIFQVIIAVTPITLVMGKISYEDKARMETLRKLGFGYRRIVVKFPEKGRKLCSVNWMQSINGLMSVGQKRNENQVAIGQKQHEQRKMLHTLGCWLAKIEHWLSNLNLNREVYVRPL